MTVHLVWLGSRKGIMTRKKSWLFSQEGRKFLLELRSLSCRPGKQCTFDQKY
jgi:hypothetical protein